MGTRESASKSRLPSRRLRLISVVLFSILPHLYGIASPPLDYHYHRQVNTAAIARNYHERGMRFFHPQIDWAGDYDGRAATELPVYMYLVGLLWGLFGLGDIWGRLLSVACSAATAAALLLFLERWVEESAAFFGALLFSLLPVEIYFGRTIQPEALAALTSVLGLHWFDAHLVSVKRGRSGTGAWLGSWLAASTAIGLKIPYLYLLGVFAVLAWVRLKRRSLRSPGVLLFFPCTLALVAAWYLYAKGGTYVLPNRLSGYSGILHYSRSLYYIQYEFLSRFPELTTTWPGVALWAAGAWGLRSLPAESRRFLWGWFGCVCIYVCVGGGYIHYHEYTALPFALVNPAFMGHGLCVLIDGVRSRWSRWEGGRRAAYALLGALLLAMPVNAAFRIKHWYRVQYPFLLEAREKADSVSSADDLFVCNERADSVFLYYIRRRGWGNDFEDFTDEYLRSWLDDKIRRGAKFFMARRSTAFTQGERPVVKYIQGSFPVVYEDEDFLIYRLRPD